MFMKLHKVMNIGMNHTQWKLHCNNTCNFSCLLCFSQPTWQINLCIGCTYMADLFSGAEPWILACNGYLDPRYL
jgi:hypothetical protein